MIDLSVAARKSDNNSAAADGAGAGGDEYVVLASAVPPAGAARTPTEVVCVVDISGSMDSGADCQDEAGNVESSGLSLLDVTKHALKTVIAALQPGDRFGLVSYSDAGRRELPLTAMDAAGRDAAKLSVEALQTEGCTNLFDGLVVGLDTFPSPEDSPNANTNRSVLILTDGQPNREPPKGHIPGLRDYLDAHPGLRGVSINTFGFGYNVESALLREIAREGSGTYTFVPDAGFVGTGFVNALGNVCSTCAVNTTLSFQVEDGGSVAPLSAASGFTPTSWGASVSVGTVQFGQSKDVLALVTIPGGAQLSDYLDVHIKYEAVGAAGKAGEASAAVTAEALGATHLPEILYHTARVNLVDAINAAMELKRTGSGPEEACAVVKQFLDQWEDRLKNDCFTLTAASKDVAAKIRDVLKDASGQVSQALSRDDWYKKWGQHYLPSLGQSHLTQRCNNFKDPGIQHYGGSVFGEVRDFADDQFNKLPPPKPSRTGGNYRAVNMAAYNNVRGGCVSGDAQVLMADGSTRSANKISAGDSVACAGGKSAIVKCVVKTNSDASGKMPLVKLGGMLITPWHPVRKNSNRRWFFPADLGAITNQECRAVYTFVLDSEHEMLINGYHYASLGHGKNDEVVRHPFWGNMEAVTGSLSDCKGWQSGFVEFSADNLLRTKDGIVAGFNTESECFNEKKTKNSLFRDQIAYAVLEMMEDDKQAPPEQAPGPKSAAATAKLRRNSQRPRCSMPSGKYSKTFLRDLEEQILIGKELVASA